MSSAHKYLTYMEHACSITFCLYMLVYLLLLVVDTLLFEAVHSQTFWEVPLWTPGCHTRFSWLHSALLIATGLWKLGNKNCITENLLHTLFERFQRCWGTDWWWTSTGNGNIVFKSLLASYFFVISLLCLLEVVLSHCYIETDEVLELLSFGFNFSKYALPINNNSEQSSFT